MKRALLQLILTIAISLYATNALTSSHSQDEGASGITRSATGHGIPYGTSSDTDFLPWLKTTEDSDYGYSMEKPVEIGGFLEGKGNAWSAQYFSSLLGPNGEPSTFERVKSCCGFEVKDPKIIEAGMQIGLLDQFEVTVEGKPPVYIYVTLYTAGAISAPAGFSTRGDGG